MGCAYSFDFFSYVLPISPLTITSSFAQPLSFGELVRYLPLLAPSSSYCQFATEDSCILK
ncbi:hypothetical protein PISMIDRAFT_689575 [Pisolithus microcarpus 441]|uniref:Uncharacterized protein n=1 Tax=Pisolithus microcarpus 441 TaxID=765257 RepID=A0A0C9YEI9_9AGAM|nr:hypothetical protein BKA83DRAFT_689575 [Pisolithus microcarpus]KIK12329.1 hypothetical protein PISMIDRAFT_689575 [Pisolithus microcarpus 441]